MRVAVMGAGLMGAQIGCEYALGGHQVALCARNVAAVRTRADGAFELLSRTGLRDVDEVDAASQRISIVADPARAAADADLVVESLPEELELKVAILRAAATVAPHAVFATNTSSLSISTLGEAIGHPEVTVGTHYLNPPLLMPPVEVVAGDRTGAETVRFARETVASLGKLPIVVRRDVPGFVWNRLQFAIVRECVWLVEHGVASAADLDTVMREGLARRWRTVGPLRSIALGGIDTWNRSGLNIVSELSCASELPDLERVAITSGNLEADAQMRDAALALELRESER